MIDPELIETSRRIAEALIRRGDPLANVPQFATDTANRIHGRLEESGTPDGHPAEVALEQLLGLIACHPDPKLRKWLDANARVRKLEPLVAYLGSEIVQTG